MWFNLFMNIQHTIAVCSTFKTLLLSYLRQLCLDKDHKSIHFPLFISFRFFAPYILCLGIIFLLISKLNWTPILPHLQWKYICLFSLCWLCLWPSSKIWFLCSPAGKVLSESINYYHLLLTINWSDFLFSSKLKIR